MKRILAATVLLAGAAWGAENFSDEQLKARFYYDLGVSQVDASSYPKMQQEEYAVFAKTCSQCHTLARPINASIATKEDWKRYITRMHLKTKTTPNTSFSKEDARLILDFLTYDSNIRKVKGKKDFDAKTVELKSLFDRVLAERTRRQNERDQKKVKAAPMPGTGVTPQP